MGAAGLAGFLGTSSASAAAKSQPAAYETVSKSFGALGDGTTDDTAAFQHALDSAHGAGGGIVYAPPGRYLFQRSYSSIPQGVTLRGSYGCVPSHTGFRDRAQPKPGDDGTALFATAGKDKEEGKPFLTLNTNSSVSRLNHLLSRTGYRCGADSLSLDHRHARQKPCCI